MSQAIAELVTAALQEAGHRPYAPDSADAAAQAGYVVSSLKREGPGFEAAEVTHLPATDAPLEHLRAYARTLLPLVTEGELTMSLVGLGESSEVAAQGAAILEKAERYWLLIEPPEEKPEERQAELF